MSSCSSTGSLAGPRLCDETPQSNKVLPGGLDATAMIGPKQFFAAARKVEEGGSLTILATATTDNGNSADEAILAELSGAANLELRLDRRSLSGGRTRRSTSPGRPPATRTPCSTTRPVSRSSPCDVTWPI